MAWSTRQLAEFGGATVKAVRHYHQVELLDEPDRIANGYKQYEVRHLVQLLRIKRLADLGVPLSQIGGMLEADENPEDALRVIDAELEASVNRLQRARAELGAILRHRSPTDLPAGFSSVGSGLSKPDRALVLIYSRVFDPPAMDELREMLQIAHSTVEGADFDALAPEADEDLRQDLASRYAPQIRDLITKYPWLENPWGSTPRGKVVFAELTVGEAIADLYNPAQVDVLERIDRILQSEKPIEEE